jgi:hypothetical protein
MARGAQIPRVACCAAKRDADLIRRCSRHSCQPPVTAKPKIRRVMRAGTREARDVGASQAGRVGQAHMTGCTCLAWNIHVRIFQSVTAETLSDDCIAHGHPGGSGLVVTGGTVSDQGAVGRILHCHRAVMILVGEAPIPGTRSTSRLPRHFRLHDAIVARRAPFWLWKHRLSGLDYPCMARRTKRKDFGMLFMREPPFRCPADKRCCEQRPGREDGKGKRRPNASCQLHRSVGRAGGSGVRSAPDPNARLIPARARTWSSDDALASGRSRSSLTIETSPHTRRWVLCCH